MERSKLIKIIAACVILLGAVIWLLVYFAGGDGVTRPDEDVPTPSVETPAEGGGSRLAPGANPDG